MTTNKLIFSKGKEERKAQTKTGVIFSLIFLTLFFSFTNVMAIPDDAGDTIDFTYTAAVNYSAQNVNNSQYHQGYTPQQVADLYVETDPDWAANYSNFSVGWNYATNASGNYVPYTGATTDVDLGLNDFIARYGNFTLDLDVMDDLFVWDNTDLYGQLDVWERARFYGSLECNDSISLEVTGDSILEVETTWANSSAQLRLLADGTNDLYIYTYGSTAAASYYGYPRAGSSYVDAQGERLIVGTFDSSPMYLATDRITRFVLTALGNLIPEDDDSYDIGNATHRIQDLFIVGEDGGGGLHFAEDDGSYGNLTMDDDFNLLWDGNLITDGNITSSGSYNQFDGDVNISGAANVTGDLHIEGNFTGEQIHGGMWYHNHTGTLLSFTGSGVYYKLFFVNATHLNGFDFDGGFGVPSNLTAMVHGEYLVNYMAIGDGQNNHDYITTVYIDEVQQENCDSHHKMAAGGDVITQSGTCIIHVNVGEVISLRTADEGGTGTGNYYGANLNLLRIGND